MVAVEDFIESGHGCVMLDIHVCLIVPNVQVCIDLLLVTTWLVT